MSSNQPKKASSSRDNDDNYRNRPLPTVSASSSRENHVNSQIQKYNDSSQNQPSSLTRASSSRENNDSSQIQPSSLPRASSSRENNDSSQDLPFPATSSSRKRRRRESVSSTESHDDFIERASPLPRETRRPRQRRDLEPAEEDALEGFMSMIRGQIRVCVHPDDHIKFFQSTLSLIAEFKKTKMEMPVEQHPETPVTLERLRGLLAKYSTINREEPRRTTHNDASTSRMPQFGAPSMQFPDRTQPIVFLGLEVNGKPLGRVRIRISCGLRWQEQVLGYFKNLTGVSFDQANNVGEDGETVSFGNLENGNAKGGNKSTAFDIHPMEGEWFEKFMKRNVTLEAGTTCLTICTRTSSKYKMGIKIGYIDYGLELLRGALNRYATAQIDEGGRGTHYDASRIKIAESGVFYDTFIE